VTPRTGSILLVDDDESLRRVAEYQLAEAGHRVVARGTGAEALEAATKDRFDLVVTDVLMPGMTGLELVDRLRASHPDVVPVVITAHGDVETAVRAMQSGAFDFLEKPFTKERLVVAVEKALQYAALRDENRRLRALAAAPPAFASFVGASSALKRFLDDLRLAADSDATVLLQGESGTGKELAARAVHESSKRAGAPLVVVNCAAIPETLVESELFGHRRGAFTGATEDRKGKFEAASRGTIFLDEVGELPPSAQARLLRVLQEGEVDTVGAAKPVRVDVRVVAATRADLEARVREGSFREDLWFRLHVVPLRIPPLRERVGDVPLLLEHFLARSATRHGRAVPRIEPAAMDRMERHDWPGNVRELENLVERLVVLGRGDTIRETDLPAAVRSEGPRLGGARIEIPPEGLVLEEVERGLLEEALRRHGGNQSAAARFLGISRQTLIYRMKKFGLQGYPESS
jgi:two-component system NtrC family response regulator